MEKERGLPKSVEDYKAAEGISLSTVEEALRDLEAYAEQEFRKPVTEEERKIHAESLEKSISKSGQTRANDDLSAEAERPNQIEDLDKLSKELTDRFLVAYNYTAGDAELLKEYEQLIRDFRRSIEQVKAIKPSMAEIKAVYDEAKREVDDFIETNFGRK